MLTAPYSLSAVFLKNLFRALSLKVSKDGRDVRPWIKEENARFTKTLKLLTLQKYTKKLQKQFKNNKNDVALLT